MCSFPTLYYNTRKSPFGSERTLEPAKFDKENMTNKHTNLYVTSIIEDVQTRFVREETVKYSETEIVRSYEFEDGAVVKYEWQSAPGKKAGEQFNHRFTLTTAPKPNPNKLRKGVIRVIDYGSNPR